MTNYYGTTAEADTYHSDRINSGWTGTDAVKLAALLVASEWIDGRYRSVFPGYRTGFRSQVREWPRQGAIDNVNYAAIPSDEIPTEIKSATYEAALRHIVAPGSLLTDFTLGSRISEVAVSGAVSVKYEGIGSVADLQVCIPAIDRILQPILCAESDGLSSRSIRA